MIFTDVRTRVMNRLGLTSTDDQTRVDLAINDKYKEITSSLGIRHVSRRTTVNETTSIGISTLNFDDCEKIINVVNRNDSPYLVLDEVSVDELRLNQPYGASDTPTKYAITSMDGDDVTIELNCIPQTEFALYADVISTVATLSGSDIPAFPISFHDALVEAVLIDEYLKLEKISLSQNAERRFKERMSDLRHWVMVSTTKDIYQGKTQTTTPQTGGAGGGSSVNGALSYTQTGLITFDRDPSAPFAVESSSAVVTNLDADMVDGHHVTALAQIDGTANAGNLLFVDATYDIGASGATRPRDLFLSRNATIGGTLGVTGAVTLSSTLGFSTDAILLRESADFISQRNGTTAQRLAAYNTYTSSTNYERFEIDWKTSANNLLVGMRTGSAGGTFRPTYFIGQSTSAGGFGGIKVQRGALPFVTTGIWTSALAATETYATAGTNTLLAQGTATATSGQHYGVSIEPTYNQSGSTASNTDLRVNRTETAVGSGTQNLIDLQVAAASKFSVNTSGNASVAGTLAVTGIITGRTQTVVSSSSTGAQNNWNPGVVTGHTIVEWGGVSDAAVTGIAGGSAGCTVTIRNITSAIITFAHNSGSSSAANRTHNTASSAATPVANGGHITYYHNGTDWRVIEHEQGQWITPTFAAGDYTASAGNWTVAAGDVTECEYRLVGRTLHWNMILNATTVSATPATLVRIVPGGFTASQAAHILTRVSDNAAAAVVGLAVVAGGSANVSFYPTVAATAAWSTATDTTVLTMCAAFEVT